MTKNFTFQVLDRPKMGWMSGVKSFELCLFTGGWGNSITNMLDVIKIIKITRNINSDAVEVPW